MKPPTVSLYRNRARGYWYARVYWPDTRTRTAYRLPVETEAQAQAALRIFEAKRLPMLLAERARVDGPVTKESGQRLRDLVAWYLGTHLPFMGRAPKTRAHYERVLGDFLAFCSQRNIGRAQQVSTRVVQEWQMWLSEFRRNGREVARRDELLALRHFFAECVEAGELPERLDISWKIPGKGKSSRFRALTVAQLREFLTCVEQHAPDIYPVMAWCAYSGWRISDVLDLRWGEITPDGHVNRQQLKTAKDLLYPLNAPLRAILTAQRRRMSVEPAKTERVFPGIEYNAMAKRLEYVTRRHLPAPVCARDLRKTFATLLATGPNPCPPSVLKELMGHSDIAMTLGFYVDVDLEKMAAAAESYAETVYNQTTEKEEPRGTKRKRPTK